ISSRSSPSGPSGPRGRAAHGLTGGRGGAVSEGWGLVGRWGPRPSRRSGRARVIQRLAIVLGERAVVAPGEGAPEQSSGGRVVIGRDARPEASRLEVVVCPVQRSTVAGAGLAAGVRHVMVDVAPVRRDLATRSTAMAV